MLTYSLLKNSSDPLYISLCRNLRNDIRKGVLKAGERLPSKRTFATNLGISVITVENAYARLCDEGYVFSMPKRGYYVSDLKNLPVKTVTAEAADGKCPENEQYDQKLIADFRSNGADPDSFPFKIWSQTMRAVLHDKQELLLKNSPPGGVRELREAVAAHLKGFHGMEVNPAAIVIGAGTEYLTGLVIQLLGFNRVYAREDPGYSRNASVYKSYNVKSVAVSVDECGLRADLLKNTEASVVQISPSHQFPSGAVMPVSRRYELLSWASVAEDRYIIEDDYDSEFRLSGRPLASLQSIDADGRVIYMNTFTKSLASTVRIGYMILPDKLMRRFYERLGFYSCTVPNFEQYALASFISSGSFELHIGRMRRLCEQKRRMLLECINNSSLKKRCTVENSKSGLHFLLKVHTALSDEECCKRALAQGVGISALSSFYERPSQAPCHVFVMSYTSVDLKRMQKAVEALSSALI